MPDLHADVAQLVEHHLAKVRVAGSNPVVRSEARLRGSSGSARSMQELTADWPSGLGKGLQSPVRGFDSRIRLVVRRAVACRTSSTCTSST